MVPKTTTPFTKLIRTGEGVLIYVFGTILVIVPIITTNLGPVLSTSLNTGKWVAIVTMVSRTGLKIVGALRGTADPPTALQRATASQVTPELDATLAEIQSYEMRIQELQSQPGTPAAKVKRGLSPSPEPKTSSGNAPTKKGSK